MSSRRRSSRRVLIGGFPSCLPAQADIEAVYLGKKAIQGSTVLDESGNGNDATLVQSACGTFDGATIGIANTSDVFEGNQTYFEGGAVFKTGSDTTTRVLVAKRDGSVFCYMLYLETDNRVGLYVSDDGTTGSGHLERVIIGTVDRTNWHKVDFEFNNGVVDYTVDGVSGSVVFDSITSVFTDNVTKNTVGNYDGGSYGFIGSLASTYLNNFKFNIAEGNGSILYNSGTVGGDATLNGATLLTFWGSTQDVYHYNIKNGFDLWENGTAGEEIRVPIGANVIQAGYTFTATHLAGAWHNGAETKIDLPDTLKTVVDGNTVNPLGYNDFEENFGCADTAFSNLEENKHKYLVFYNRALTEAELTKIIKCTNKGLKVLTSSGEYICSKGEWVEE